MDMTIPPSDWSRRLREFSARNACRRTIWELEQPLADMEAGEPASGGPFLGASYDPWAGRIRVMLGDASGVPYYRTNAITDATDLEIVTDAAGRETAMRIKRPSGEVVLRFDGPAEMPRRREPRAPAASQDIRS
jgi:hypothetical protein